MGYRGSRTKEQWDIDKHIGRNLRARRVALGLSQEVLAAKVGLTFQQIQKYENGANRISGSRMYQLCGALGVEPNYFFEGLDKPATTTELFIHRREALEVVRLFFAVDKAVRSRVYALLKALAKGEKALPAE